MVLVNMVAKWFKILDSLHGPMNEEMIEHASQLVEATKIVYHVNYSDSHRHITDYELMYVPIPKQTTGLVGFSFSLLMHQLSYVVIFICVFVLNSLFSFFSTNCGFFMLKFLKLWNGSIVPTVL
jgi:hypothetical protein